MKKVALLLSRDAEKYLAEIALPSSVRLWATDNSITIDERLPEVEGIISFPAMLSQRLIDAMPKLEWIQALTTGTDALNQLELPDQVIVTNARGIQSAQICELVFLQMLWFQRDVPAIITRQASKRWEPAPQSLLAGKHLLIVGVGKISEELALRAITFGMKVSGCSANRKEASNFSRIVPLSDLASPASEADFIVVLSPYRKDTHHLIDQTILSVMPAHSVLINVARGRVVDEEALYRTLATDGIRGAALDVFSHEPLSEESPLWNCPNLLITPHIGGLSENHAAQVAPLLTENLTRWGKGQFPLVNEIPYMARYGRE